MKESTKIYKKLHGKQRPHTSPPPPPPLPPPTLPPPPPRHCHFVIKGILERFVGYAETEMSSC